ncbi:unnamed protein product [Schistosoma margrebowiei]|uniref:Uncharacterized protein n=1 Tax=Schistosoma margrebowiei TaxID=48269 RepID=A0A183MIQ6_9TREM|nr:unnamed protein product [Schistosoma margrebowiei]
MVVEGSQQEILDIGFVLLSTRQQAAPQFPQDYRYALQTINDVDSDGDDDDVVVVFVVVVVVDDDDDDDGS